MASNHLMDSIESMVQCTVCFEIMKEPKMLPCLHRFCLHCLQRSISALGERKPFLCPLCRKPTPIPPGGAGSFNTDFMISQMVDMVLKQKEVKEERHGKKNMMLVDPTLLKMDSNIFPKGSWSVDDICSLPSTIVVVGSSYGLNCLLASCVLTMKGTLRYTSDLSPNGSEQKTQFLSCVAAINEESVVVACTGRILTLNIASGRSEHSKEIPNNRRPKSIAANSNIIIVHMFSSQHFGGVIDKRFQVFDHSLNFLVSIEVDDGDGLVTSISLTDTNFFWVDYYTANVYFETLEDLISEKAVEKIFFCKPSTETCKPLSICCDSMDNAYVLWRVLGETGAVIAGGKVCYDSCKKVVAQYSVENPKQIVNKMDVDDKSHRVLILDKNMDTEKLIVVTKNNLFYSCGEIT